MFEDEVVVTDAVAPVVVPARRQWCTLLPVMMRALVVVVSMAGCATVPVASGSAAVATDDAAKRAACCGQCTSAAQRDPAGLDISGKDCRSYAGAEFNSGPGVDEACVAYFTATPTTRGACSKEGAAK